MRVDRVQRWEKDHSVIWFDLLLEQAEGYWIRIRGAHLRTADDGKVYCNFPKERVGERRGKPLYERPVTFDFENDVQRDAFYENVKGLVQKAFSEGQK